jgi:quercetin dioxygenase-like cupin family protein
MSGILAALARLVIAIRHCEEVTVSSSTSKPTRDDRGKTVLLTANEVQEGRWKQLDDQPGVTHTVLWRSGDVVIGMIRLEPGAENPEHVHQAAHHHFFLTQGEASIVGRRLQAGGYAHIPPGQPHGVTEVGPEGCTFFYSYRPMELAPGGVDSPLDDEWGANA